MKFPPLLHKMFPTILGSHGESTDTLDRFFGAQRATQAGEQISPESAKRISAYFACIRVLSEDVAKLPLNLMRRGPNGNVRATDHPLFRILRMSPNPAMTAFYYRQTVQDYALSWGNGISEIVRNGLGDVVALWPIHAQRIVNITLDERIGMLVYEIRNAGGGGSVKLPATRVLDIKGMGDGIKGISVATHGRQSLGLTAAQQTFGASFFGNGTALQGILEHPGELNDEARQRIKESFQAKHGGPYNAFTLAMLEEGMTWKSVSMPMTDAQFLENKQFQVEEIARWFRMPPHKIQHLLRATFDNIEASNIDYVVDTLDPWLIRWEQEIQTKLISPDEPDLFVEFEVKALLRGDSKARGEFLQKLFQIGALSPNDALRLENMDPIGEEGDTHYVPVNMVPVGTPIGNMPQITGTNAEVATSGYVAPGPVAPLNYTTTTTAAETPLEKIEPFKRILKDVASRMVRKEVSAAKRHAKKSDADFEAVMGTFYQGHHGHIVESLIPVTTSIYETLKSKVGPAPFLATLADELCETGFAALRKAREAGVVDQVCDSWNENKVHTIMTRVIASALPME